MGASVAADAVEAAFDAEDDSAEDAEDAALLARLPGLVGMDLLDQVWAEGDGLGGDSAHLTRPRCALRRTGDGAQVNLPRPAH